MRRLAVLAHYHPLGGVADHVLRQVADLATSFDRVIVATTSPLSESGRAALSPFAEVLDRANVGQDFGSWFDGMMVADFAESYDELLLTNDSYVQVEPIDSVIERMTDAPVEVWGATKTWRRGEHIQSYFLYFTQPALQSKAFRSFWDSFRPATDRRQAIELHELGISRTMRSAGFRLGGYLVPTLAEKRRATRRGVHWLKRRRHTFPAKFHDLTDSDFDVQRRRDPEESRHLNPATVYADSVFDHRRYPLVKFDTLRYDPYWLGSDFLLDACEERFPEAFADVRRYIESTARFYPQRAYENGGSAHLSTIQRQRVGYTTEPATSSGKAS